MFFDGNSNQNPINNTQSGCATNFQQSPINQSMFFSQDLSAQFPTSYDFDSNLNSNTAYNQVYNDNILNLYEIATNNDSSSGNYGLNSPMNGQNSTYRSSNLIDLRNDGDQKDSVGSILVSGIVQNLIIPTQDTPLLKRYLKEDTTEMPISYSKILRQHDAANI